MGERVGLNVKKPEVKSDNSDSRMRRTNHSQSVNPSVDSILFLQRTVGNQAVQRLLRSGALQAKLRIGQPGDVYEQEADRVADAVMRMPEPKLQHTYACGVDYLQCSDEQSRPQHPKTTQVQTHVVSSSEQETNHVADDATGVGIAPATRPQISFGLEPHTGGEWQDVRQNWNDKPASPEVDGTFRNALNTEAASGRPMSPADRAFFEPRFGLSFQHVHIHDGPRAAALSREISARAFTHGEHIYLAEEQHDLESTDARRLIAHELTHTLQQRALGPNAMALSTCSYATACLSGILSPTPDMRIQRWEDVQIDRQLLSFSGRRGAQGWMNQHSEQNQSLEYRIVEREDTFVIQSRARATAAESPGSSASAVPEVAEGNEGLNRAGRPLTEDDRSAAERELGTPAAQPVAGSLQGPRFVLHHTGAPTDPVRWANVIPGYESTGRRSAGHGAGAWVPRHGAFTIAHQPLFGPRRPTATRWERGEDIVEPQDRSDLAHWVWSATDPDFGEDTLDAMLIDQGSPAIEVSQERQEAIQQLNGTGRVMSAGLWAVEDICSYVIGSVGESGENFRASELEDMALDEYEGALCDACVELESLTAARRWRAWGTVNVEIAQVAGSGYRTGPSAQRLPPFTDDQYQSVMQLYLHAALEAGTFPEITTHFVVDRGIGTHIDPRCFDLGRLYRLIAGALDHDQTSRYGAEPSYGTRAPANVWWDNHVCGRRHP